MTTKAVYVVGAPGVGKTSFVAAYLHLCGARDVVQAERPVPHVLHEPSGWTEIGRWRVAFGGTDALGYTILPQAVAWVASDARPPLLIGEGDRLAVDRFVRVLHERYDRFTLVHLVGDTLAAERAAARAERLGRPPQNEAWRRGRASKAANLADRWADCCLRLDASEPPMRLAQRLADHLG